MSKEPRSATDVVEQERKFLDRLIRREPDAWDAFVERYAGLLYDQIYRCLRRRGALPVAGEEAEDLFLSVFQSFLENDSRKLRQFEGRCSLARWIRMVTTSHVVDHLRKRRATVSLGAEDADGLSLLDRIPDDRPSVEDALEGTERRERLVRVLRDLTAEDRLLLELTYAEEMPAGEIAALLGTSREAVYTRRHRLLARLRKALGENRFG